MNKVLDDVFWHDGKLGDITFSIDKKGISNVKITALISKNEQASSREHYQIKCEDVSYFNCTLDATELKKNMSFGNISNGYLKENTLWIYFADGVLEIRAKKFYLEKC
jgi:hypothetical protein